MRNAIVDVINLSWPTVVIVVTTITIMRIAYIIRSDNKYFCLHEEIFNLIFIVYLLILFELVTSQDLLGGGTNLIPFKEILRYNITSPLFLKQVIGNILLFVPLGYFATHYCKLRGIVGITIISLISSATIEITQHYIGRSVDIDDVILNVFGGIIGYLMYKFMKKIEDKLPRILRRKWFYNIISILIIILIAVYLTNLYGGI